MEPSVLAETETPRPSFSSAAKYSPFMAATICGPLTRRTVAPIFESARRSMTRAASMAEGSTRSKDSPSACQNTASNKFAANFIRALQRCCLGKL